MKSRLAEKFTHKAKKSLINAFDEAKKMGASVIDTEHLLLGLLNESEGAGAKILNSFKLDFDKVREVVLGSSDPRPEVADHGEVFTEATQESLSTAALQAYIFGYPYIGTEHILYGLAKTTSGLACHILRSYGVTAEIIKEKIAPTNKEGSTNKLESNNKTQKTPMLNSYSRDLTLLAKEGKLDPVVGRDEEINRCLQILLRRTKNNPVLLGEAGVGKTAIVEGLAQKIMNKEVPEKFANTRLINLDLNALVAGTRFRGDFEERLVGIIEEIKESKNIILFIDEIQTIVGAGGAGGALDAANILKPALARGELRCIGACTSDEYSEYIEEDPALERRFQPVYVEEPSIDTTVQILSAIKNRYEDFHEIKIKNEALKRASQLAKRFLTERHLPDSAIDIIDEAASKKSLKIAANNPLLTEIGQKLASLKQEKEDAVKEEDFDGAEVLRRKEKLLERELKDFLVRDKELNKAYVVTETDVEEIVANMTGIPLEELSVDEAKKLLNLEKELGKHVIGQQEALTIIAQTLRRSRVGLTDSRRPIGSFLFLGTTGVGKTLIAQTLAKTLFDDEEALIRFDMSEFTEKHTIARLLGAPPGYVGYEEGGELTERMRRKPYSVILFDEIEKAHPEIWNNLLSALDYGRLVDGKGREVSFRNSIIIMTSNVGTEFLRNQASLGFKKFSDEEGGGRRFGFEQIKVKLIEQLKNHFRAEFINRIDSVIVFKPLGITEAREIAKLAVRGLQSRLKEKRIRLSLSKNVFSELVNKGYHLDYGARPMRKAVTTLLEEPLSMEILEGKIKDGNPVLAKLVEGRVVFEVKS